VTDDFDVTVRDAPVVLAQIGKYELRAELGKGATGTVYLAHDTFAGRDIALKVIDAALLTAHELEAEYRTLLLNEASLAGKLHHPHIVSILEAVIGDDAGYIAMEMVAGSDLSEHVHPNYLLPIEEVLQIGFKCCGALDYAFQEGIFHRDLKPANIMRTNDGKVKIADFGAALLRRSRAEHTSVTVGSPHYMSPEQIAGKALTYHSDMYSLGAVLYTLLTGRKPFSAPDLEGLTAAIAHQVPPPPSSIVPGIPPDIDRIVLRALEKKPTTRYAYYDDFADDLASAARALMGSQSIPDSEKYVCLKRCEALAELPDAELWELVRAARWHRFDTGEIVMREMDEGDSFFYIGEGKVRISKNGRVLGEAGSSTCFGEMAYIFGGDRPRQATVAVVEPLLAAEFQPFAMLQISASAQLQLMRMLVLNLSERLENANSPNAK
jgi:eukaryotic-like serine/threonine-protein kinase